MWPRSRKFSNHLRSQRNNHFAFRTLATERRRPHDFYVATNTYTNPTAPPYALASSREKTSFDTRYRYQSLQDHRPNDERQLRLGKTIRTLHEHLPSLLQSPLPQEILSPHITLRLFPSTHPHLPTVSGRLAYVAALWTSPVAWGRIPVIGNVKLVILSERLFKTGGTSGGAERLIVRWRTCSGSSDGRDEAGTADRNLFDMIWSKRSAEQTAHSVFDARDRSHPRSQPSSQIQRQNQKQLPTTTTTDASGTFAGIFIFEFDGLGRLHTHTIEHAEEGGNWEKTTSKVINVTDWLLGRAWGRRDEELGLALGCTADSDSNAVGDAKK